MEYGAERPAPLEPAGGYAVPAGLGVLFPTAVTLLSARNLFKAYGQKTLFSDASITLSEGDRVGLLGVNGSGKSTLLRVLAGLEPLDKGTLDRRRGIRVLYLSQEPELRAEATARGIVEEGLADWRAAATEHAAVSAEIDGGAHDSATFERQAKSAEAIERLGGWDRDHVVEDVLGKVGIYEMDRPVGTMSGGERRRVALARLLVAEPDLAILDEPTNHLDTKTIEWLEEHLARMRGALLLVTHDRYVLDAVATRVFELEFGVLREFRGNYSDYLEQKATLLEHEARTESNRLNLIRRERAWLMRGARARTTKQKARIQRAEEVIAVEAPRETGRVKLEATAARTGRTILELQSLGLVLAGRELIRDLTLHMVSGDRIGVIGPNGSGKTSLLKMVTGELLPTSGHVNVGKQTKIAYFDQARAGLVDEWSVFDNVAEREGAERTGGGVVRMGNQTIDLFKYLEYFLFDAKAQRQKVASLSGGERARVALAKMLKSGHNLLLLDEPTNDLDIATLGALEEMLTTWPGCALVVTHDRYFLNRVATSLLAFESDGSVAHYAGDYDAYQSRQKDAEKKSPRSIESLREAKSAPPPPLARPLGKPLSHTERLELETLLDAISRAEQHVKALERKLADPLLYATPSAKAGTSKGVDAKKLQDELAAAEASAHALTARWEALEARRDLKR